MNYVILATADESPGTPLRAGAYTAAVYDAAHDRSAVVRFDFDANQVTSGTRFSAPVWSNRSVDYVASWQKGRRALGALARRGHADFTRTESPEKP